jgi:hypothetical protein
MSPAALVSPEVWPKARPRARPLAPLGRQRPETGPGHASAPRRWPATPVTLDGAQDHAPSASRPRPAPRDRPKPRHRLSTAPSAPRPAQATPLPVESAGFLVNCQWGWHGAGFRALRSALTSSEAASQARQGAARARFMASVAFQSPPRSARRHPGWQMATCANSPRDVTTHLSIRGCSLPGRPTVARRRYRKRTVRAVIYSTLPTSTTSSP